jgi:hypothetical protein
MLVAAAALTDANNGALGASKLATTAATAATGSTNTPLAMSDSKYSTRLSSTLH